MNENDETGWNESIEMGMDKTECDDEQRNEKR